MHNSSELLPASSEALYSPLACNTHAALHPVAFDLCPVWYPGRGRSMLCPRSAGTFFASKTQAKAAWWARPEQGASLEVLRWIQDGVKIKFRKDLPRLHLSPRLVPADKVEFVIQDQAKGRAAGAYVDS